MWFLIISSKVISQLVFLLYKISHFHFVTFFFLLFIAIHQFFFIAVELIHITVLVLQYNTLIQYLYGINFI